MKWNLEWSGYSKIKVINFLNSINDDIALFDLSCVDTEVVCPWQAPLALDRGTPRIYSWEDVSEELNVIANS
jgi:hypothetical protein